jgi:hypothetical protein
MIDHVSYVEVSKTCGEPRRTIEKLKWLADFAECAGESQ